MLLIGFKIPDPLVFLRMSSWSVTSSGTVSCSAKLTPINRPEMKKEVRERDFSGGFSPFQPALSKKIKRIKKIQERKK